MRENGFQVIGAEDFAFLRDSARELFKSQMIPPGLDTAEKVLAIILTGREIGIPTMAAIRGIQIVGGVPVITPALMLALAFRSKDLADFQILESTEQTATVRVRRKDYPPREETFTLEQAELLGFAEQAAWTEQPRAMLRWHAIALALRFDFADLFFGLFLPHEIEGASADGMGTAYAQASELHAESAFAPSRAIMAARAVSAVHAPAHVEAPPRRELEAGDAPAPEVLDAREELATASASAPAPQDSAAASPSPFRQGEPHATTKEAVLENHAAARAERQPCPDGQHVFLGLPRCAACNAVDPRIPPPPRCGYCQDKGTIPIDPNDPSKGETGCLNCVAIQTAARDSEESRAPESAPSAAPASETSAQPESAPATATPAPSAETDTLFTMEGVGQLQMDIFFYAEKILPPGAKLREAMEKWIQKRYNIAGGLPGLVKHIEETGAGPDSIWKGDPVDELKVIRDLFQSEAEKKEAEKKRQIEEERGK